MKITELVERSQQWSARKFIVFRDRTISFGQFYDETVRVADALHQMGVGKGHRVSLLLPNVPEFAYCAFGAQMLGAIPNLLSTRLNPKETLTLLGQVRPKALVTTQEHLAALQDLGYSVTSHGDILVVGEDTRTGSPQSTTHLASSQLSPEPFDANHPAFLLCTSGTTTGRPKGVLHSHGGLSYMLQTAIEAFGLSSQDTFLCVLPLYHVFGLVVNLLAPLALGATVVIAEEFQPQSLWQLVSKHGCTVFSGVPTMYSMLLRASTDLSPDASTLRLGICAADALDQRVKLGFANRFLCQIIEAYGTTEAIVSHMLPYGQSSRGNCIGRVLDDPLFEAGILDEAGQPVPPHETGEIVVRSPSVMLGYYDDPEGTAQAIKGGWFHTGDLGYRDSDGYFYLVGRRHDMIKRGGERIVPREVETVLCRHPKILDAAVVGIPDRHWGQEVKAFVVLKPGQSVSEDELIAFCRQDLAEYKVPKVVEFVESLPRDSLGKVSRRLLLAGHLARPLP